MTTQAELLQSIFGAHASPLSVDFALWISESRRFRVFADTYRDKIRKKLRLLEDEEALKSLYAELETAYLLLADARFTVEYEKYAAAKGRSPDFTLAFRVNTVCNLEVTRLRFAPEERETDLGWKITEAMLDKVGQMMPSTMNVLLIVSEQPLSADQLAQVAAALRGRAERKDEVFFTRRGFEHAGDFIKHFRQLSSLFYRSDGRVVEWNNSLAKHPLPKELLLAFRRALSSNP